MPAITTVTRGHVYVLRRHRNGRSVKTYNRPATWKLLDRYYDDLPLHVQRAFVVLEHEEGSHIEARREWAEAFIEALDQGEHFLPRQRTNAIIRRDADYSDLTTREAALVALWEAEEAGMTVGEVKRYTGVASDGISGALSELVQARVAVRLDEKR